MKIKIFIISIIFFLIFSLLFFSSDVSKASYVTSSTSSSTKTTCTNCSWVLYYWQVACIGNFAKYAEGYNYTCRSYGSKSNCCSPGDIFWHWLSPVYRSSCDSSIWSFSNAGSPPQSCTTIVHQDTTYTCHYISSVNSWSACNNGVSIATSVNWSSVPGQSCSDVATTRSCCSDSSWTPAVSTVCIGESLTQISNCGATRSVVGTKVCNTPPAANITSPISNPTYEGFNSINFSGTATDPEGDAISAYDWREAGCGAGSQLSNQASFVSSSGQFSAGSHTVYFRAQDNQGAWSACDQESFTIRPSCDPATAPAGTTFCSGDNENLTGGSDIIATEVNSSADCTAARKCEYYLLPINGAVGSAHSQIFCQRPSENLCDSGTPSDVTEGDGGQSWIWTCQGLYGGSDTPGKAAKSCAYKETNPN